MKNMYYLDVNFYRYYIGRQDQSVNETVMISRIDQQIRVTKLMIDYLVGRKSELVKNRRLYQYMRNYLEIIMAVSSVLLIRSGTTEHLEKKKELWEYLKGKDKRLYLWMRNGIMGGTMNLPGRGGRKISVEGYRSARNCSDLIRTELFNIVKIADTSAVYPKYPFSSVFPAISSCMKPPNY